MKYHDLFASEESLDTLRSMGWSGFCVPVEYDGAGEFKKRSQQVKALGTDVLVGALITSDVGNRAKSAIEAADLVIVDVRGEAVCRDASESYEVDLIVNPELNDGRDLIDSRSSGLDHVTCAFLAERDIGYCINLGNVLYSSGVRRAQLLSRIQQNVRLERKYGVKMALSCAARRKAEARNPHDIMNFAANIGLSAQQARQAASANPQHYIQRALQRSSPDIITHGLTVATWGAQGMRPKRKSGWY
jgi:RNase P/RNase MRP subunit p30